MGDVLGRAQAVSEVYQDAAMRAFRARTACTGCNKTRRPTLTAYVCEGCGRIIPPARMKANPAATRCVPCQEKYERGGGLDE